jgi:hypothetical protein
VDQGAEGVVVVSVGHRGRVGQRTDGAVAVVDEVERLRQTLLAGEVLAVFADALQSADVAVAQLLRAAAVAGGLFLDHLRVAGGILAVHQVVHRAAERALRDAIAVAVVGESNAALLD